MALPRSIIIAVANAVEAQHGDLDDVRDLLQTWERLAADSGGRVDRLRAENEQARQDALAREREE